MTKSLAELREDYQKSVKHAHRASSFWASLKNYKGNEGTILAYKASALALKARQDWNPLNKFNWINECMNIFQEAVKADQENIEIRFLRFAIQHNTPDFLRRQHLLDQDKSVILKNFERFQDFNLNVSQLEYFHGFFEESKRFSPEELTYIKHIIHLNH